MLGHHWHASETSENGPVILKFGSALPSSTKKVEKHCQSLTRLLETSSDKTFWIRARKVCASKTILDTVKPAKSDSDVMFCLKVIRDLGSIDYLCINPIRRIGLYRSDLSMRISSSGVYKLMF